MSVDREKYEAFVKELVKGQRSKVINREKGELVIKYLKGELTGELKQQYNNPRFRFYVRNKGFEVLKTEIAGMGMGDYLFQKVVEHGGKKRKSTNEEAVYRRVAYTEDFYDILTECHNHSNAEGTPPQPMGYKRCLKAIQDIYTLFPRSCVQTFCNMCTICKDARENMNSNNPGILSLMARNKAVIVGPKIHGREGGNNIVKIKPKSRNKKATIKQAQSSRELSADDEIDDNLSTVFVFKNEYPYNLPNSAFSKHFMEKCQIEVIEMNNMDQHYSFVGHFIDHYSNYHVLFPLINTTPSALVQGLSNSVFGYFGVPKVFLSTLGSSFLSPLIDKIHAEWPNRGNCGMSIPHPNRHDLIKNSTESEVKEAFKILACENSVNELHVPWVRWIPLVQYRLNTQVKELNDQTPFQKVFKHLPRSISLTKIPGGATACNNERMTVSVMTDVSVIQKTDPEPVPEHDIEIAGEEIMECEATSD